MGHHIDDYGQFQSDKHPDLPPDRIRINFQNPRSWRALLILADDYQSKDRELSEDIRARIWDIISRSRGVTVFMSAAGKAIDEIIEKGIKNCDFNKLFGRKEEEEQLLPRAGE